MPTPHITLSLPQDEIDNIREAADSESVASLTARALRRELRARKAAAYAAWNESLPEEVRAGLNAWDAAPMPFPTIPSGPLNDSPARGSPRQHAKPPLRGWRV